MAHIEGLFTGLQCLNCWRTGDIAVLHVAIDMSQGHEYFTHRVIMGLGNSLSNVWHQAITWTIVDSMQKYFIHGNVFQNVVRCIPFLLCTMGKDFCYYAVYYIVHFSITAPRDNYVEQFLAYNSNSTTGTRSKTLSNPTCICGNTVLYMIFVAKVVMPKIRKNIGRCVLLYHTTLCASIQQLFFILQWQQNYNENCVRERNKLKALIRYLVFYKSNPHATYCLKVISINGPLWCREVAISRHIPPQGQPFAKSERQCELYVVHAN